MSEATLQNDIQRELLRITGTFSSGDVVINDWSILDGGNASAPYVNILSSDTFTLSGAQTGSKEYLWNIPLILYVAFDDWMPSRAEVGTARQTVIDALSNTESYLDASGRLAYGMRTIRNLGPIEPYYDHYPEEPDEALPIFLYQILVAEVAEVRNV